MQWKLLLQLSSQFLKQKYNGEPIFWSWCAWTTFTRLELDAGYWTAPMPTVDELGGHGTADGGAWRQPFYYDDLAHLIIPRKFIYLKYETGPDEELEWFQDIEGLSDILSGHGILHSLGNYALDIKIY